MQITCDQKGDSHLKIFVTNRIFILIYYTLKLGVTIFKYFGLAQVSHNLIPYFRVPQPGIL